MRFDLQDRLDRLAARWPWLRWALGVQRRVGELHGNAMASAITLTAFLSLFPLLLVAIAVLGFVSNSSSNFAHDAIEQLGLTGSAAHTVTRAIATAQRSRRAASVVGLLGLFWGGLGLAGAVATAYNAAWQVNGRGLKDRLYGLAWLVGMGVLLSAAFSTAAIVGLLPNVLASLGIIIGVAANTLAFVWTSWILPNRRVAVRRIVPAAIVGGVGFEVLKILGALVVPRLVQHSSELYGTLGVVFGVLAWLLMLGRLLVYVAVIEVSGWESDHGTEREPAELPKLPDGRSPDTTRAGTSSPA